VVSCASSREARPTLSMSMQATSGIVRRTSEGAGSDRRARGIVGAFGVGGGAIPRVLSCVRREVVQGGAMAAWNAGGAGQEPGRPAGIADGTAQSAKSRSTRRRGIAETVGSWGGNRKRLSSLQGPGLTCRI
jgi:hypothetical protein